MDGQNPSTVLSLKEFLELLKEEEDYWEGEQNNTQLMISKLRKIFYDQWGWNSELIPAVTKVKTRYVTAVVDNKTENSKKCKSLSGKDFAPKHRTITYSADDRIYGDTRVGITPEIYKNDHEEVKLPDGFSCDIAHVLAGMDAHNHPINVSPLPKYISFLDNLFPHVNSSLAIVTWLGDIASISGDYVLRYRKNGKKVLTSSEEQKIIDADAPGSDMLGNIDAYVISNNYEINKTNGLRVTEIFEDYYFNDSSVRKNRISIFCRLIGLKEWNGSSFSNEKDWMKYNHKQLRDNITFQIFSLSDKKLKSLWLPFYIWLSGYREVVKIDELLAILLIELKKELKNEGQLNS